ncbi:hypothetical protein GGF31_000034 [Allomyces arbusculus]|nr:hypothetical protein GGF31_000034 [Allomyces arbusculus]
MAVLSPPLLSGCWSAPVACVSLAFALLVSLVGIVTALPQSAPTTSSATTAASPVFLDAPLGPLNCTAFNQAVSAAAWRGAVTTVLSIANATRYGDAPRTVTIMLKRNTTSPNARVPAVVWWHGTGDQPLQHTEMFDTLPNVLFIAPSSSIGPSLFEWSTVLAPKMFDVWLMDDLAACLAQSSLADTNRIYAMGFSAGGIHASHLSLLRPHYLAASILHSGGLVSSPYPQANSADSSSSPYAKQSTRLPPVLAITGGPNDKFLIVNFTQATSAYAVTYLSRKRALGLAVDSWSAPAPLAQCTHTAGHKIALPYQAMAMVAATSFAGNFDLNAPAAANLTNMPVCNVLQQKDYPLVLANATDVTKAVAASNPAGNGAMGTMGVPRTEVAIGAAVLAIAALAIL